MSLFYKEFSCRHCYNNVLNDNNVGEKGGRKSLRRRYTKEFMRKAPSPTPSPAGGEGYNISPP
jgi:hypothetical protein